MPTPLDAGRSTLRALALAAASLVLAATALPGISRADTAGTCATAAMSAASQPACWRPFSTSSPFNTELPTDPALAPDSAAVQQHMATYGWSLDGSGNGFTLSGNGTRPMYFASSTDPVMTIHCTDEDGPGTCQGTNGIDVNGAQINVPSGAMPDSDWDAHMTVIETATDTEYDFWHVTVSGSTLTAGSGSETNLGSDGTGSQGDAAYFALSAGLLRPSELASGQIDHALVITVPCTNATGPKVGYTYPALGGWGEFCGQYWNESASTAPMLGQRFQLAMTDAQIAASGAPAWEQTIMTALAHYGAYIEDTNGSWHYEGMDILTQDPTSWTSVGQPNQWASVVSALGGSNSTLSSSVPIPVSRLQLVNTCITQGTCPGATGPAPSDPPTTTPTTPPATSTPASGGSTPAGQPGSTAATTSTASAPARSTTTKRRRGSRDRRRRMRALQRRLRKFERTHRRSRRARLARRRHRRSRARH